MKSFGAIESSRLAREAARQMGIQLIERHVASPEELKAGLRTLKPGEMDAFFEVIRNADGTGPR